jgi:indole-3-glycerol phosphate synthase
MEAKQEAELVKALNLLTKIVTIQQRELVRLKGRVSQLDHSLKELTMGVYPEKNVEDQA